MTGNKKSDWNWFVHVFGSSRGHAPPCCVQVSTIWRKERTVNWTRVTHLNKSKSKYGHINGSSGSFDVRQKIWKSHTTIPDVTRWTPANDGKHLGGDTGCHALPTLTVPQFGSLVLKLLN